MKEIQIVAEALGKARMQGRGCFCVVRCTTPESVAEARAALQRVEAWTWYDLDATHYASGHDLVAAVPLGPQDVAVAFSLPGPEKPTWHQSLSEEAAALEGPNGPRLVAIVGLKQMKAMNDLAPRVFRAKKAFVAWPEPEMVAGTAAPPPSAPAPGAPGGPDPEHVAAAIEAKLNLMESGPEKARLMLRLGLIRAQQGRVESARVCGTKVARLFKEAGDLRGLAQSYELLATLAEKSGNGEQAIEWLQHALDAWHGSGDEANKADCHAKIGHLFYVRGGRDRAAQHFQLAIEIDEALGNKAKVAAGLRRLGLLAEEEQKFPLAEKLYSDAADVVRSLNDRVGLSRCYHHLGRLCERMGEYREALKWHTESLALKEELSDRLGMATSLHHLGNTHLFLKDLASAREHYEKALVIEQEHGDFQGRAATTQQLAEVAMYDHRWPDALRDYLVAQQLWRQLGSPLAGLVAPQIAQAKELMDPASIEEIELEAAGIVSRGLATQS